jgi:hypothetical protein
MTARLRPATEIDPYVLLPNLDEIGYTQTERIKYPTDSGQKVFLSKELYDLVAKNESVLVVAINCEIWPSYGHLALAIRFREALGEVRPIQEVVGHEFQSTETDDATSLIVLATMFYWDCLVVSACGKRWLYLSHEECFEFASANADEARNFVEVVSRVCDS